VSAPAKLRPLVVCPRCKRVLPICRNDGACAHAVWESTPKFEAHFTWLQGPTERPDPKPPTAEERMRRLEQAWAAEHARRRFP
jgi:hypothetical protein